jgi:type VI secretion system protein ImpH
MNEPEASLEQELFTDSYEFDFFQAVRLLHLLLNDRPDVGGIARPAEEPVRFKARQSLEFQASSIHALAAEADPPRMIVAFLGLTGVQGVLPHFYTEHILARAQAKDFAMAEFFDLFNHRLLSLFYRAWEKHRFPVRYQLAAARNQTDDFTEYLFDWIGLGTAGLRGRLAVPDRALIRYAGLIGQRPACAIALGAILRDHFGVAVEIQEFMGAWHRVAEEHQSDLSGAGANNCLGAGAIAGEAVWDPQASFRVRVGPLRLEEYLDFLPGKTAAAQLRDLVRFYVGPALQFDLQLLLLAGEVPWPRLGEPCDDAPRLAWCGWLKTESFTEDAAEAVFAMNG